MSGSLFRGLIMEKSNVAKPELRPATQTIIFTAPINFARPSFVNDINLKRFSSFSREHETLHLALQILHSAVKTLHSALQTLHYRLRATNSPLNTLNLRLCARVNALCTRRCSKIKPILQRKAYAFTESL